MIYNDKEFEIEEVEAFYIIRKNSTDMYIKVLSKDGHRIMFSWKEKNLNPRLMKINKPINLVPYIFWDVTLVTKDTYYLFDLTKDKVELTRLDDNLFKIDVYIEKPDIIYCPLVDNDTFKNLIINTTFSFCYEDKYNV